MPKETKTADDEGGCRSSNNHQGIFVKGTSSPTATPSPSDSPVSSVENHRVAERVKEIKKCCREAADAQTSQAERMVKRSRVDLRAGEQRDNAPSPSGVKDSGVKSLALVRAPARLRVVERRSSSPTYQVSPIRQRSPTRQRSAVRRRSPARQHAPGRALHLKDDQCSPTRQRSPSLQRLSGRALQPVKNQRSQTRQRSPGHQRSPARQHSSGHPEKLQRLPTR
ncbi:serine/arginine-rich splicing factor 11-like [Palaemon carinicauda]|uniref:serine/arginine-rich splicing factor 11-like n=1 Tax=Palaemon carinicauda TaxID=392227 RepID=UPI0035B649AB